MKVLPSPRILLAAIGVLPLVLSLASVQPVRAATARADISISLVANYHNVRVGQEVTYTARMTNHGPDDAIFVDTVFSWPDQLQVVSMTCDHGISPDSPNCEYSTLKAGDTVVSRLVAIPGPTTPRKFKVTARVGFEIDCSFDPNCTFDPRLRNNSASVTTRLRAAHH